MTTKVDPTVDGWEDFWIEVPPNTPEHLAQQVDGKWYVPKFGSDSLKMTIELNSHSVQEAKAEMVAEIENSKIISSIGYRPSKFRGLSAVAIYNMALDDLLASLKQEEVR